MRFGEFVLSSGATSSYYVDVRKTSLHPEGLRMIARLFFEALKGDDVTAVGGLTLGADPLVAGVMIHSIEAGRPLDLGSPNGVALGPGNRVYIAERLSARLQIREIIDEP